MSGDSNNRFIPAVRVVDVWGESERKEGRRRSKKKKKQEEEEEKKQNGALIYIS